ncbi:hypothetical protein BpHYR1_046302 [Brachionus plicatilis]|uniref:Uncharacterized protein n=1 Tax=Brachionus plicatilis TaxID=10195 RepID=A0A3M7SHX0_BRAPC|nr:hypothetical protein BpHYR1_046302 [Brachionus plicatilis]
MYLLKPAKLFLIRKFIHLYFNYFNNYLITLQLFINGIFWKKETKLNYLDSMFYFATSKINLDELAKQQCKNYLDNMFLLCSIKNAKEVNYQKLGLHYVSQVKILKIYSESRCNCTKFKTSNIFILSLFLRISQKCNEHNLTKPSFSNNSSDD